MPLSSDLKNIRTCAHARTYRHTHTHKRITLRKRKTRIFLTEERELMLRREVLDNDI